MDKKTKISIGFLFSENRQSVALMPRIFDKKLLLTGIGGHVEDDENFLDAMTREFYEETSVLISDFMPFFEFEDQYLHIQFFKAFSGYINKVKSAEGESANGDSNVLTYSVENLHLLQTHPNIQWLIPMALDEVKAKTWIVE